MWEGVLFSGGCPIDTCTERVTCTVWDNRTLFHVSALVNSGDKPLASVESNIVNTPLHLSVLKFILGSRSRTPYSSTSHPTGAARIAILVQLVSRRSAARKSNLISLGMDLGDEKFDGEV